MEWGPEIPSDLRYYLTYSFDSCDFYGYTYLRHFLNALCSRPPMPMLLQIFKHLCFFLGPSFILGRQSVSYKVACVLSQHVRLVPLNLYPVMYLTFRSIEFKPEIAYFSSAFLPIDSRLGLTFSVALDALVALVSIELVELSNSRYYQSKIGTVKCDVLRNSIVRKQLSTINMNWLPICACVSVMIVSTSGFTADGGSLFQGLSKIYSKLC